MKRIILIFTSVMLMISLLAGCGGKAAVKTAKVYADMQFRNEEIGDGIVLENNRFILHWNDTYKQVMLTDKQSGRLYSTMPTEAMQVRYDETGMTILNNAQIQSPIIVSYYSAASMGDETSYASTDAIDGGAVYTERMENGLRVTYDFSNLEISVPVEYTVADDHFDITVHPEEISDNGDRFVTGVAIAPFICGIKNDTENSYLFLPDGSGALIEPKTIDLIGKQNEFKVYGDDLTVSAFTLTNYERQVYLPVFGSKKDDSAITGIITSGAEQASFLTNIGSRNIGYSTVYPFFRMKGYENVKRPPRYLIANYEIKLYGKSISDTPLRVSYYFLSGDKADYNGMAEVYRGYLLENDKLVKSKKTETAVNFKILGGVQKKAYTFGVPRTVLYPLTTVAQAQEMSEYFKENIEGEILVELCGFGQSGMNTGNVGGGFKAAKKLGNKKQFSDFTEFCGTNKISLFMNFDIVRFKQSGSGFSAGKDTVKLPNGQTAYRYTFDNVTRKTTDERYMLLARNALTDAAQKAVKAASSYGISGVSFDLMSYTVYSDYANAETQVCAGMADTVSEIFSKTKETNEILAHRANDYAAGCADYVIDTPLASSEYHIESVSVPFYSLVFRGYVPMGSESVNLSENWDKAILRCAESGVAPTFTLLYNSDETIVVSEFSSLCGSSYKGIRERIVKSVNDIHRLLARIDGAQITDHRILENKLRVTTFENGVRVAVNYTDEALTFEGNTVGKQSYLILEGI